MDAGRGAYLMTEPKTALIVGASRGLGLGLVETFAARGWSVIATVRNPAGAHDFPALAGAGGASIQVRPADVADDGSIAALEAGLDGTVLDLLFLNAGVYGPRGEVGGADPAEVAATLLVNATGPARAAYALVDRVRPRTGVVAFMTSQMGSIADNRSGGSDVYRASKAAQNAYARSFHLAAAQPRGITTLSLHPGWVRTDMGGAGAPLDVATSVRGLAEVVEQAAGRGDHRFVDYSGRELPW